MTIKNQYQSFEEFYPFYLSEHMNPYCRLLHFIGTICVIITIFFSILVDIKLFLIIPLIGYGFAWMGHFIFEKNHPATFTYPLYSLIGDWVMFKDIIFLKESIMKPKLKHYKN